jgi:hypothetical protein
MMQILNVLLLVAGYIHHYHTFAAGFSPQFSSNSFIRISRGGAHPSSVLNMAVSVGDNLPDVTLKEIPEPGGMPIEVKLMDLLKDRKVAILGIPGAFTPSCTMSHLPSFMKAQEELKQKVSCK